MHSDTVADYILKITTVFTTDSNRNHRSSAPAEADRDQCQLNSLGGLLYILQ